MDRDFVRSAVKAVALAVLAVACSSGRRPTGRVETSDGGTVPMPDGGVVPDGGTAIHFGGPGPWPIANAVYGAADGIRESPVVGMSTDEAQNIWIATRQALYL